MTEHIKEIKQPLGLYDLFGYLLPGFFFYALFIIDFDGSKIMRYYLSHKSLNNIEKEAFNFKLRYFLDFIFYDSKLGIGVIPFIIFLIFCYITGHIMASFSSFLAKHIIKRYLKHPTDNLFPDYTSTNTRGPVYKILSKGYTSGKNFIGKIMSLNYKRAFHSEFRAKFKEKIDGIFKYEVKREDYYWLTYAYICANHASLVRRIQHFVNLSGFARNVTGTFIFYLLVRLIVFNYYLGCLMDKASLIIITGYVLVLFIMLWTYLRLHKRQAVDMYYIFMSIKEI